MDLTSHLPDVYKEFCLFQILCSLSHKLQLEVPTTHHEEENQHFAQTLMSAESNCCLGKYATASKHGSFSPDIRPNSTVSPLSTPEMS